MLDANAHIRFLSEVFLRTSEAVDRAEDAQLHFFSCLHVNKSYLICAT